MEPTKTTSPTAAPDGDPPEAGAQRRSGLEGAMAGARPIPWHRVVHVAVLYFVVALTALHVLQPGVSARVMPTSVYVLGLGGLLMTLAFFALGAALVAAALGLRARLPTSLPLRAGVFFMALGALAACTAGLFPTDGLLPTTPPVTPSGRTHVIAARVAFPSFVLGPLFLTLALRGRREWRRVFPALALLVGLLVVAAVVFVRFAPPNGMVGAVQRLLLGLLLLWLVLVARRPGADR